MKILIYKWNVFNQHDIKTAFEYFGHDVEMYEEQIEKQDEVTGYKSHNLALLSDVFSQYDLIFSLNYFPHVSDVCEKLGIIYISWTVDSPLISLYHESVYNSCNRIFIFDRFYCVEMKKRGIKNIYYLPLAVDTERLDNQLALMTDSDKQMYRNDVTFVGSMYHRNSYDKIKDKLSPYLQGYFQAAMMAQMCIYGDNIIDEMFTVDIIKELMETLEFKQDARSFSDIVLVFSSTFLGFKLANMERVKGLNKLADSMNVSLYTDEFDDGLVGVNNKGTVSYMTDAPKVFNLSKINLNFTIRNIRTGIPLRVWDILGAGGFLLTNFQVELPDFFQQGRDMVYFQDLDDCKRKAEYYLSHEDERMTIAKNGHDIVKCHHSYKQRVENILHIIMS